MLRLSIGSCMLRLRLSIGSCMLRLRLSIGSCMLRLKLSCTGSGPVILTWHAQLHAHSRFLCPTSLMCHHLLNNGERRFTEKVIHVQEMDSMSTAHKILSTGDFTEVISSTFH